MSKQEARDYLIIAFCIGAILAIFFAPPFFTNDSPIKPHVYTPSPITAEPQGWQGLSKPQVETNPDCPVAIEIEYTRQGDGYLLNEVQWAWMRDQIRVKTSCLQIR